jgi:spermidine synthase
MTADARRYVRSSTRSYDVVIADLFHPARSGSGSLYTVEHFKAVRERLAVDGLFCQWLPLHQLDIATLRSIVRSFLAVYPDAAAVLATHSLDTPVIGLIARRERGALMRPSRAHHEQSPSRLQMREELQLDDELAVLGSIVAGPAALSTFSSDAPLNTDDRPVVAHRAPRTVTQASPRERLLWLLRELHVDPAEVLGPADDDAWLQWQHRLAAYWTARTRYIEAGMQVRPSDDVRALLAQVQQPLLQVLQLSADFRPAYDPLLNMAVALARVDRAAAIELLNRLQDVQPTRIEATQFLQQLASDDGRPSVARSIDQ